MGQSLTSLLSPHLWREDEPNSFAPYQYDPLFGFEDRPRPEKIKTATHQEMESVGMDVNLRDFCSGIRAHYMGCIAANGPLFFRCKGLNNELKDCYMEELVHDMKEFEREKRLNARERRMREKQK